MADPDRPDLGHQWREVPEGLQQVGGHDRVPLELPALHQGQRGRLLADAGRDGQQAHPREDGRQRELGDDAVVPAHPHPGRRREQGAVHRGPQELRAEPVPGDQLGGGREPRRGRDREAERRHRARAHLRVPGDRLGRLGAEVRPHDRADERGAHLEGGRGGVGRADGRPGHDLDGPHSGPGEGLDDRPRQGAADRQVAPARAAHAAAGDRGGPQVGQGDLLEAQVAGPLRGRRGRPGRGCRHREVRRGRGA
jgi:hypothetical protein